MGHLIVLIGNSAPTAGTPQDFGLWLSRTSAFAALRPLAENAVLVLPKHPGLPGIQQIRRAEGGGIEHLVVLAQKTAKLSIS
jgi:hypothetical protein